MASLVGDRWSIVGWAVLSSMMVVASGVAGSGGFCGLAQAARVYSDSRQRTERTIAWLAGT